MEFNTELSVDLEDVKDFIESDKFVQFLLNNTTQFATAAFCLQTLHERVEELMNKGEEENG